MFRIALFTLFLFVIPGVTLAQPAAPSDAFQCAVKARLLEDAALEYTAKKQIGDNNPILLAEIARRVDEMIWINYVTEDCNYSAIRVATYCAIAHTVAQDGTDLFVNAVSQYKIIPQSIRTAIDATIEVADSLGQEVCEKAQAPENSKEKPM